MYQPTPLLSRDSPEGSHDQSDGPPAVESFRGEEDLHLHFGFLLRAQKGNVEVLLEEAFFERCVEVVDAVFGVDVGDSFSFSSSCFFSSCCC